MRIKIKQLKADSHKFVGQEITIKGWVKTVREQKTFSFIEVNDGSTLTNFQVIVDSNLPDYEKVMKKVGTGVSIALTGPITEAPDQKGIEMHSKSVEVIGAKKN